MARKTSKRHNGKPIFVTSNGQPFVKKANGQAQFIPKSALSGSTSNRSSRSSSSGKNAWLWVGGAVALALLANGAVQS